MSISFFITYYTYLIYVLQNDTLIALFTYPKFQWIPSLKSVSQAYSDLHAIVNRAFGTYKDP